MDLVRHPDPADPGAGRELRQVPRSTAPSSALRTGFAGPRARGCDRRGLLWSDIEKSGTMRWYEETGLVSRVRKPSNFANAMCNRQGRRHLRATTAGA